MEEEGEKGAFVLGSMEPITNVENKSGFAASRDFAAAGEDSTSIFLFPLTSALTSALPPLSRYILRREERGKSIIARRQKKYLGSKTHSDICGSDPYF